MSKYKPGEYIVGDTAKRLSGRRRFNKWYHLHHPKPLIKKASKPYNCHGTWEVRAILRRTGNYKPKIIYLAACHAGESLLERLAGSKIIAPTPKRRFSEITLFHNLTAEVAHSFAKEFSVVFIK